MTDDSFFQVLPGQGWDVHANQTGGWTSYPVIGWVLDDDASGQALDCAIDGEIGPFMATNKAAYGDNAHVAPPHGWADKFDCDICVALQRRYSQMIGLMDHGPLSDR